MARLPDIPVQSWLEDQATRFHEATGKLFDALEFDDGAKQAETTIPPDYPLPGGPDQWNEAEQKNREEELRRQQDADEQARQQAIDQRVQELQAQQQQDAQAQQQQAQARDNGILAQARSLGIPTPDQIFGNLSVGAEQQPDHTSTSGLLDQVAPPADMPADTRAADEGAHEQTPAPMPTDDRHFIPTPNIVPLQSAMTGTDSLVNTNYGSTRGERRDLPNIDAPINVDTSPAPDYVPPEARNRPVAGNVDEVSYPSVPSTEPYGPVDPAERNRAVRAPDEASLEFGGPEPISPHMIGGPYPNQMSDTQTTDTLPADTRQADEGPHEAAPDEQFSNWARQMNNPVFGPDQPAADQPDNTSSSGLLDPTVAATRSLDPGRAPEDLPERPPGSPNDHDWTAGIRSAGRVLGAATEAAGSQLEQEIQQPPPQDFREAVTRKPDMLRGLQIVQDTIRAFGAEAGKRVADELQIPQETLATVFGIPITTQDVAGAVGATVLDPTMYVGAGEAPAIARAGGEALETGARAVGRGVAAVAEEGASRLLEGGLVPHVAEAGGGGSVPDVQRTIDLIRQMRDANLGDDIVLQAEQKLAQDSPMTLDEIQRMTRGAEPAADAATGASAETVNRFRSDAPLNDQEVPNPFPLTDEERALNEAADAKARSQPAHGGYTEDPTFTGEDTPAAREPDRGPYIDSETGRTAPPSDQGSYIDSETGQTIPRPAPAAERGLPVDAVPEAQAPPAARERITGVGAVPEGASEEGVAAVRQQRRFFEDEQPTFTQADLDREVDAAMQRPGYAQQVREAAQNIDPEAVGTQQGVLARSSYESAQAYGEAAARARDAIRAQQNGPASEQAQLALEAATAVREAAERFQEMQQAVQGSSLSARAASRALNALRGPYEAARGLVSADRLRETSDVIGRAVQRVGTAIKTGVVDDGTLQELENVRRRLTNPRTRKLLTDAETEDRLAGLGAGGAGRGGGPAAGGAAEPEESLAERLGRLKREQTRLGETGSPADRANIADDITDVIGQIRDAAQKHAADIVAKTREPLTLAQAEAAVNRAIGQPVVSKYEREALASAKGFTQAKFSENLTKSVEDAITRRISDERKLQESIETQMNRRLQAAIDQEKRAKVRDEVRGMANDARTWIQRIRQMPNEPALREEFEARLGAMAEHSNTGEVAANELRQQLASHLGEDSFQFMSGVEQRNANSARQFMLGVRGRNAAATIAAGRQAAREAEQARIASIVDRIDAIRKLPHAPDSINRLQELYADLTAVGQKGFDKSSTIRRTIHNMSLTKAGLDVKAGNADQMRQLLANVDPDDPATLRPVMELMGRPSLWRLAREISFVNLLSRPTTNITNATSSAMNIIGRLLLQNPLEFMASGGYNTGGVAAIQGAAAGISEGARLAGATMRTGMNPRRVESQLVHGSLGHIEQELIPLYLRRVFGTGAWDAAGKLGVAMHAVSTRPLEAMDSMLGHIAYSSGVYQGAQRKADQLIREGADISQMLMPGSRAPQREQVMQNILANIWDHEDIIAKAGKIMDYSLFRGTGNSRLEQALRNVMAAKEPGATAGFGEHVTGALLDLIIPFWNVPVNFAKQGIELTTGAIPLARAGRAAVQGDRERFGEQMAKALIGAGTTAGLVALAAGDNLTDMGPTDPGQRKIWLSDHKPNSWRIPGITPPGVWMTWEGTPWAVPAGTVAGAVRAIQESGKKAEATPQSDLSRSASIGLGAVGGAMHGIVSNTLLQNIMETYQLLSGEGATSLSGYSQFAASSVLRYTPSPIPTGLLSFLANVTDSMERDAGRPQTGDEFVGNVVDRIKQGIPGLREQTPTRLSAYGEDVPNTRAGLYSVVPLWRGQAQYQGDPVTRTLEQAGVGAPPVNTSVPYGVGSIPLTPAERRDYQQLYDQRYRALVEHYRDVRLRDGKPMTDTDLVYIRGQAQEAAQNQIIRNMGSDEDRRRRFQKKPVVEVSQP